MNIKSKRIAQELKNLVKENIDDFQPFKRRNTSSIKRMDEQEK